MRTNVQIFFLLAIFLPLHAHAARITGTVSYSGLVPQFPAMSTSFDPACPGNIYPDILVVGPNHELANTLVYVKDGVPLGKYDPPAQPVVLNQIGCRYEPHVFAAMIGQQVVFTSQDQTLHTVDVHAKANPSFGVEMPKGFPGGAKTFNKEELMIPIMCSVHPWMLAFGSIFSHPFFFVSEKNGRYLIDNLSPGTYTLEAWHEKLGALIKTVTIKSDNELAWVDFNFASF